MEFHFVRVSLRNVFQRYGLFPCHEFGVGGFETVAKDELEQKREYLHSSEKWREVHLGKRVNIRLDIRFVS